MSLILTIEGADSCRWVRPSDFKQLKLTPPVVLINGAFDLLHPGHLRLIQQARKRAGTLVCALDSDVKIRDSKGIGRPIMSWIERAVCLSYVGIDYIVEINTDQEMSRVIKYLQPNFRIQGADYMGKVTGYPDIKRLFVRLWGTGQHKCGTSDLIERCKGVP